MLVYLRDYSKEYAEAAEQLHKKGLVAAAYARMLAAWAYASSANQIYDVLSKVQAGKLDDAVAHARQRSTSSTPDDGGVFR